MPMWYAFVDADVARVRRRAFQSIPFIHNTPKRTTRNQVREGQHLAHVTLASFLCSRHATRTALTDTDQSRHTPIPRVNPGSEPVQPPRLAGVWTVADHSYRNTFTAEASCKRTTKCRHKQSAAHTLFRLGGFALYSSRLKE
jgi:hypothetical protein